MSLDDSNLFSEPNKRNEPSKPNKFDIESFKNLIEFLDNISYESKLGKNLKNTLRKFDKEELIKELNNSRMHYRIVMLNVEYKDYRIKSLSSISLKYNRYYPSKEVKSCFNDILGFRVLVSDLKDLLLILKDKVFRNVRVVDLSNGKIVDDGYRAVHIYYQKSNYHYPIEVQFWNEKDYAFHNWLHKYSYKYLDGSEGVLLRNLFEVGLITDENSFIDSLELIKRK